MVTGLLGLGNVLLQDARIGVHVVTTIREKYDCPTDLAIIDGGTLGLDLLPCFEKFDRVLIVHAIDFGKEPGYVGILEDHEIYDLIFPKISVHHLGLADILTTARLMGVMPSEVCLIGMQPSFDDFTFSLEMSDAVNFNMPKVIDMVLSKLKEWEIECVLNLNSCLP